MISIDVEALTLFSSQVLVGFWRLVYTQTLPLSVWFFASLALLQNVMSTPSSMFVARLKFVIAYGLFVMAAIADLVRWAGS